ncbi:hypothetical protein L3Q82_019325 [Scortum barcoo]|uniref:Uncharacterized protein n=1 Tax=Scortum barcoo TaxID=214431 RepID=A0ACB8VAY5_9TELE|nr:hypothetical protein L3Q82_019325 [Scortum barcoo]
MAEVDLSQVALMSLEDELTCSICLSPFDCPVTIPCGHNFCQDCLLATWKDSYSCPQCRTHFATKPELKKNTVLSTVVETLKQSSTKSEGRPVSEERKDVIRCDTCMEAEASKTCLTCMASFCEEHLRPHRENPIFRPHQLTEPVSDLSERFCPDHYKLMELFCSQHGRPICSLCLQQEHKGCSLSSPEEQRNLKESDLRAKLLLLNGKILKTENIISQMRVMQNQLKDAATNRKKALTAEYQQMRDVLAREESEALTAVDRELDSGQDKLNSLKKKFSENIDSMSKAKEDIDSLLSQSQTLAFLQVSFDLPPNVNFDPYTPRINLDSKKVIATQASAVALKEYLTEILKKPVEARLPLFKAGESAGVSHSTFSVSEPPETQKQKKKPRSHSPGRPLIQSLMQPTLPPPAYFIPSQEGWNTVQFLHGPPRLPAPHSPGSGPQPKAAPKKRTPKPNKKSKSAEGNVGIEEDAHSMGGLLEFGGKDKPSNKTAESEETSETSEIPPNITSAEKRHELLKYGTVLTLDPKTAHKRIALTEDFTKASVSDEHTNYPDCPERFAVCSQVLASKGFSQGRHYWEVILSSNNFIGIGLAYKSIDRKGPASRLGRNTQSWCVEWFNVKLSAWHNSSETVLENPNPKRVGVLLDCEEGTATFYKVADRAYPFHSFVFPFAEAVYPAFWIFSSGSSISLCKLQ